MALPQIGPTQMLLQPSVSSSFPSSHSSPRSMTPLPHTALSVASAGCSSTNGSDQTAEFEAFLSSALETGILTDALIAQSTKEADAFWAVREGHKLSQVMPNLINLDISLDIGQMGEFVETCRSALHLRFPTIRALFFGHAGDGNLHIVADQPKPGQDEATHEVYRIVYDLVRKAGGSISAEHGIGTLKRDYLSYSRSPEEIALMRGIKSALDPDGILNLGKLL